MIIRIRIVKIQIHALIPFLGDTAGKILFAIGMIIVVFSARLVVGSAVDLARLLKIQLKITQAFTYLV